MSIFSSKKPVEVSVDYVEIGDNVIIVDSAEQKEIFADKIKTAKAKFERPNWKNFNINIDGCMRDDTENGRFMLDPPKFREKKLRNLLLELIDGDGVKVNLDDKFFTNVLIDFAVALVDAYDKKLSDERLDALKDAGLLDRITAIAKKKAEEEEAKEKQVEENKPSDVK